MNTPVTLSELKPALAAGAKPRPIIPTDMDQVWRFAQIVAKSGMAPKGMERAETITVALLHGLEIGLPPLMALQRIAVINGRPAIWGDAAIGLVRASGLCEGVSESVAGDGDGMVATCRAKRKGEKDPTERMFSVDDAKRAGLWNKTGPWQQYPKRMLQMRARAFALRDLFADVLGGLYIAEELEGDEPTPKPPRDVTPRPLPPPLPPRTAPVKEQAQEAASEPAGAVIEAEAPEAPEAPPKAKRPLPPAAKPRGGPTPAEGAAIPGFLDRTEPAFDGAQWLKNLERAASGCEDAAALFDVQERLYKGSLMRAAPADRKKAQVIMNEHFARLEESARLSPPQAFIEAKKERDAGWPEFEDRAAMDARREAVKGPQPGQSPAEAASRPRKPPTLSQQAALACKDEMFWKFAGATSETEAATLVRMQCGVSSRSEIKEGTEAGRQWNKLYSKFRLWVEHPELDSTWAAPAG